MIGKFFIGNIADSIERVVARKATEVITPHLEDAVEEIFDSIVNEVPSIRSTGGATKMYLEQIQEDFKDFHAEDAKADIQTFILEMLNIKYGIQENFDKAKVSEKVEFNIHRVIGKLQNIKINNIAIYNYKKTLNSATIIYRVSVGYDYGGTRREKLYEVEYTLQLRDEYGAQLFLECKNCGAPLEESTGICKYCGMKHLRDTIENWVVTNFKEL